MGQRTLKRVPLDFKWPLAKVWEGYLNPYDKKAGKCPQCDGDSYTPEGRFLEDAWYRHSCDGLFGNYFGANILAVPKKEELVRRGCSAQVIQNIEFARLFGFKVLAQWVDKLEEGDIQALVEAERLMDFTHTWSRETGWVKKDPAVMPTPDQVNAWSGTAGLFGHDAINRGVCVRYRCEKAGFQVGCPACVGSGEYWPDKKDKALAEAWKEHEPPKGSGWQLWETTTEGSPMSPVFATAEELAAWCADHRAMGLDSRLSKEQYLRLMHDPEKFEMGSMIIGSPGRGITTLAEVQMGKATPKDWTPKPR